MKINQGLIFRIRTIFLQNDKEKNRKPDGKPDEGYCGNTLVKISWKQRSQITTRKPWEENTVENARHYPCSQAWRYI